MPTSAACSEGASLMPSPMKPTTWPARLSASDDAVLLRGRDAGEHGRALGDVRERGVGHALDLVARARRARRRGPPRRRRAASTSSSSPVRIFTATPSRRERRERVGRVRERRVGEAQEAREDELALVGGGAGAGRGDARRQATASTRKPSAPSVREDRAAALPRLVVSGTVAPSALYDVETEDASGAPLVTRRRSARARDDDRERAAARSRRGSRRASRPPSVVVAPRARRIAVSSGLLMPVSKRLFSAASDSARGDGAAERRRGSDRAPSRRASACPSCRCRGRRCCRGSGSPTGA